MGKPPGQFEAGPDGRLLWDAFPPAATLRVVEMFVWDDRWMYTVGAWSLNGRELTAAIVDGGR